MLWYNLLRLSSLFLTIVFSYSYRIVLSFESFARTLSVNGALDEPRVRENFALSSITPMALPDGSFPQEVIQVSSVSMSNFEQVDFTDSNGNNSSLNRNNLLSISINSTLSEFLQGDEIRPLIVAVFALNNSLFPDPSLTGNIEVGSVILSFIVDTNGKNVNFDNLISPIEFQFQVTEVSECNLNQFACYM